MSEQYHGKTQKPLNANLVGLLLVAIFALISGVIFIRPSDVESAPENSAEVAQVAETATVEPPAAAPVPPTETPVPLTSTPVPEPVEASSGQAVVANAADYDPALVAQGEQLFLLCSACHGPDAHGLPNLGKDLVASEFVGGLTDDELRDFVKTGRPIWDALNTTGIDMPPKGGNPAMTDDDLMAIIAYIRTLRANAE